MVVEQWLCCPKPTILFGEEQLNVIWQASQLPLNITTFLSEGQLVLLEEDMTL
jgi:hypothetical protein